MAVRLTADIETFPIAGSFSISRGTKREAAVVVARLGDGTHTGQGEAVPYARYGETIDGVRSALDELATLVDDGPDEASALARLALGIGALPPGAARNAADCALLDLLARRTGVDVSMRLALPPVQAALTCFTLSLDTPEAMAERAAMAADLPVLKLKLGAPGDTERLRAVRRARPDARLVADANEGIAPADLAAVMEVAAEVGLECLEQPLPAGQDQALSQLPHRVPICADESFHTAADVPALVGRYDAVNVKLDKAGGLTAAHEALQAARDAGLKVMVGCMVATSLAMAPALRLAPLADWLDLDGPLLLAADRPGGLVIRRGVIAPPAAGFWGNAPA